MMLRALLHITLKHDALAVIDPELVKDNYTLMPYTPPHHNFYGRGTVF